MGILDILRGDDRAQDVSSNKDKEAGAMSSSSESSVTDSKDNSFQDVSAEDVKRQQNAEELRDQVHESLTPYPQHFPSRELDRDSLLISSSSISGKSDAINAINSAILQLSWLKDTIEESPSSESRYLDGVRSITECISGALDFLSVEEGGYHASADVKQKACLTIVQMERDSAKAELNEVVRKNHSLSESLNKTRKHLLAAIPAYYLALETADALYEEVLDHIESNEWLENDISANGTAEGSFLDGNVVNHLRAGGIKTYRELSRCTEEELLSLSGIGPVSVRKIQSEIERLKIPSFSKVLSSRGKFSHPILYKPSGDKKNVTFTEENMWWLSKEALDFEGWRAPRAISAISKNSEFTSADGTKQLNHHYFGGFTRDFDCSEIATRPFFKGRQYDYHFLKLTPLDRMIEKLSPTSRAKTIGEILGNPLGASDEEEPSVADELLPDDILDIGDEDFEIGGRTDI